MVQKYENLKEEILKNHICWLDRQQFDRAMFKSMQYVATQHCKSMKSWTMNHSLHYGIRRGLPLDADHLLSIILYSDYSKLCYEFSKTFRRIPVKESDDALRERNREYWNWSKLLRETVEFWGAPIGKSSTRRFYSGCSYLVLDAFVASFCGPTSTSPQLAVATIFAKSDGLILELEMANSPKAGQLTFFDCSFISCYSSEGIKVYTFMFMFTFKIFEPSKMSGYSAAEPFQCTLEASG